ncbi:nidogen-like domain-containing protein [Ditylenchus destructor]|uniref:Nidogen-like domain-containing protein n=1 Tax=Ditylenchus destructor TaxID=166010 RepID=A0AAD4R0C2_9BILA|nr:nidogen-like domain-containing protein [Ditylenchus destructor]
MTHQSFSLIFLIALFPTSSSGISLDRFLPYGTTHGDTEMERGDDTGSPALQLSVPFPFFDTLYSTLWVNVNGAISFAKQISKYTPVCGPVEREYSSIAPFWADVDIRYTGYVFYRQTTVAKSLEKAQKEISSAFSNFAGIKLKWLLVATWLNVTYYPDRTCCGPRKRNTFQAIITTDGRHSFAIFYYQNLTWTTGAESGGRDGLGGTPAQAGFDFGDGNHRLMIPGSCTGDVLKINEQSNVGDPGKWVFRVDRAAIQTAGCTQGTGKVQLRISPSFVYTITRQPIELVGPCVENAGNGTGAFCRFFDPNGNTTEFDAKVHVNGSSYAKFTCPTPFFYTVGRLRVELHVSSGQSSKTQSYNGHFYTLDPHSDLNGNQLKVELETVIDAQDPETNKSAKILKFSWDPKIFPENQGQIQVGLLGLTNGKNQSWNEVFPLVLTEENKGVARVDAAKVAEIQEKFNDTELIQRFADMSQLAFYAAPVVPSSDNSDRQRRFANLIVPFLSLTKRTFSFVTTKSIISTMATFKIVSTIFGTNDSRRRTCQAWYNTDPGTQSFNLPDCPCTSEQADNDADFERDGSAALTWFFHPGADHCVRSKRKSAAQGGQQCCYDKGGKLLVGPPGGGTEDWGSHGDRNVVSNFLSHARADILTWHACCWDDPSGPYCKMYYEKRPSKDCRNYRPKRKAAVIGDPHMRTFDGLSYTFNGIGEFWLLINNTDQPLALQGRMERQGSASVVTALAMKTEDSSLVQIQYSRVRVVDIFIDRIPMDLSQDETLSVEFSNVSVSVTKALDLVYVSISDGHTLELRTGFGFGLSLSVPTEFEGKTEGLFGTLDDDFTNDLRARNGSLVSHDASLERIHYDFGLTWKIREEESLFDYFEKDYAHYNPDDKEFSPNFNFDPSESSAAARELCGDNWACLYDFDSTGGDAEMANRTRRQVEAHETWRNVSNTAKVPPICPPLNHPKNGLCLTSHLFEGAEAQCHCFPGFEFPESNNGDEIRNRSVLTMRCQISDAESTDESDNVKSVSWIPEVEGQVTDCEPAKPEEECKDLYGCSMPDIVDMTPEVERLVIPEGVSVNFSCRWALGSGKLFPDPYIIWKVNGSDLDCEAPDCHEESENGTSVLTLKNIKQNESQYCCFPAINHRRTSRGYCWNVIVVDKQPDDIEMAANPEEECEEAKSLYGSDIVLIPYSDTSFTDEYGFHDNHSFTFYCATRGKNTEVYFTRMGYYDSERLLGNATEEDMTRSEIEQIIDRSFVNSSKCITGKRLTVPFTSAESAGLYHCIAKNSYDYMGKYSRLKLERSGGVCHFESEYRCADGRQCVAKSQVCNGQSDCADLSDERDRHGCSYPLFVDMKPDEVLLEIPEDGILNLTCRAIGKSDPLIKWRVNGTEISCAEPDCQQVSENGTGTLTLKNVKRESEGAYTCEAIVDYQYTVASRDWIVRVVDRMVYGKEIPDKFLGYWKLDHNINFNAYLNARYHSRPVREKAENDMKRKTILRTGTGSYSWVSKEGIYDNVVLGKEFPCTSSFCADQSKWVLFEYLPANETIIETQKINSKPIYDYKYTLEDGFLVKHMEWGNVLAKLFYRNDDSK